MKGRERQFLVREFKQSCNPPHLKCSNKTILVYLCFSPAVPNILIFIVPGTYFAQQAQRVFNISRQLVSWVKLVPEERYPPEISMLEKEKKRPFLSSSAYVFLGSYWRSRFALQNDKIFMDTVWSLKSYVLQQVFFPALLTRSSLCILYTHDFPNTCQHLHCVPYE